MAPAAVALRRGSAVNELPGARQAVGEAAVSAVGGPAIRPSTSREPIRDQLHGDPDTRQAAPVAFHLPALPDIEAFLADARAILESGRLSEGPYVRRLESASGRGWATATSSPCPNCSDGLIAALSLVAEPGCEVILPGYTYLATWQAIVWAGMIPVVADVDDRGLLDPGAVEAAITVGPARSSPCT